MIDKSKIGENLPDLLFFHRLEIFLNCLHNLIDQEE